MPDKQPPSRDVRSSRPTVGGPAEPREPASPDTLAEKVAATADLASAFPFNPNKASEYDPAAAVAPPAGAFVKPDDPIAGSSTVSSRTAATRPAADRRTSARTRWSARSIASASIRRPAP